MRVCVGLVIGAMLLVAACGTEPAEQGECGPGTYGSQCVPCEEGYFCAGGEEMPVALRECRPGEFVTREGSAVEDRLCESCEPGSFSDEINATSCREWTECAPGEYIIDAPSAERDRVCVPCNRGRFSTEVNASGCALWTVCVEGEYVEVEGTGATDRQCASCLEDEYSIGENAPVCQKRIWKSVSAGGGRTCAVREDSTLWCWGSNTQGALGLGHQANRSTPQQVTVDGAYPEGWKSIDTGKGEHTCAVREDSTLWCWGMGSYGALGQDDLDSRSIPHQVLANDDELSEGWKSVSAGEYHTCAVREDSTLWCWGQAAVGQLGLGDFDDRFTPQQVKGEGGFLKTGWKSVSAGGESTCAIREDTTLWCWGGGSTAQLGIKDAAYHPTPQQVEVGIGAGTTRFRSVASGRGHSCAIREDNTLWCWGQNITGQLGNGSWTHTSAPQQVLTNVPGGWRSVTAGDGHSCGVAGDSSLWCWGRNQERQLGREAPQFLTQPRKVLEDDTLLATGWRAVSATGRFTCAVRENSTLWCWGVGGDHLGQGVTPLWQLPKEVGGGRE